MVNDDDRDFLVQRLTQELAGADPRARLSAVLPTACMEKIQVHNLPFPYALDAVKVCVADKWHNTPSWLSLLILLLPNEARVVTIRRGIEVPRVDPDPTLASVLVSEVPFLDRENLRRKAKALTAERVTRPILVVKGKARSGKSFTAAFINHLVLSGAAIEFCLIKFPAGDGRTIGPEQVARQILQGAGVDISRLSPGFFQNTTNNVRWPYDLALSVLNACASLATQYWIILDEFGGDDLRNDTRQFVDGLGESISSNTILARKFRLLLLGFDRASLTVQPMAVDIDDIQLPGLTHVTDCVGAIFDRFERPRPDVPSLVSGIMSGLPQDDTLMDELYKRLVDLIAMVREEANV